MISLQFLANTLIEGAWIALLAVGFGIAYRATRVFHFAFGAILAIAPHIAYVLIMLIGFQTQIAIVIGLTGSVAVGIMIETLIYRPARRKGGSGILLLLSSLGTYVVIQNILSLCFSDSIKTIEINESELIITFLGSRFSHARFLTFASSIFLLMITGLVLKQSGWGRTQHAVGEDPDLAKSLGVNVELAYCSAIAASSFLAGFAGILLAIDVGLRPTMGMSPLLLAMVAVLVGGVNSYRGWIYGGLLLAIARQFSSWILGERWADGSVFVVLLIFLLLRPFGIEWRKTLRIG